MSFWDNVPEALEADLTQLTEEQRAALLEGYLDEDKAAEIVTQIDGSASDYVANIKRIDNVLQWINFGMGSALRVAKLA